MDQKARNKFCKDIIFILGTVSLHFAAKEEVLKPLTVGLLTGILDNLPDGMLEEFKSDSLTFINEEAVRAAKRIEKFAKENGYGLQNNG